MNYKIVYPSKSMFIIFSFSKIVLLGPKYQVTYAVAGPVISADNDFSESTFLKTWELKGGTASNTKHHLRFIIIIGITDVNTTLEK